MAKIVTYIGNNEILITAKKQEEFFLATCFGEGSRSLSDYDRMEHTDRWLVVNMQLQVH